MKRGFEATPSTSFGPPKSKLRYDPYGDSRASDDESFKNARRVAEHYSARSNQTLEEREASPIIHLKKLNNWIKSVLIQLYARSKDAVLDIACGKGGDLIKWDKAKIGYYVGVDIAEGSIKDCRTRYNGDSEQQQRRKKFGFPARLICADFYEVPLDKYLQDDAPFDICSCQFALHYSWSTEVRARQALANVSALLRPGGIFIGTMPDANVIIKRLREADGLEFGNSVYWISFEEEYMLKKFKASSPFGIKYKFHLEDAVDCPEWIVPFHVFKSLADEYGLDLVFAKNSHEFVNDYLKKPEYAELMRRLGALGDGNHDQSTLSQDEWDVAYLYLAFVLKKRGQPSSGRRNTSANKGKMYISEDDIEFISS
ncbi:mRNA cap guanine-N(7) methyltransferase 1 [Curcuma longa]|uniref:mRNA cap guanine-N(7) methyltransferase 1 n=1 Tax=Curcuma longa TaxID=136217 RepID=UPI003D9E2757